MKAKPRPVLGLPAGGTVEDWTAVLARIDQDREAAERELGAVAARRRELALRTAAGDPAAVDEMAGLNERFVAATAKLGVLDIAAGEAGVELRLVEERVAAAVAEAKRGRLRASAEVAGRLAAEVDAAAGELKAKLDAFRAAVDGMVRDGLDSARANKLRNSTKLRAALQAAGLGGHLGLERVAASHREALGSWTRRLLAGELGKAPPEPMDPRALAGQLGPPTAPPSVAPAPQHDPAVRW